MYRNRLLIAALLTVGLVVVGAGVQAAGSFDVSSYIPQHFKDVELRVDANFSLSGSRTTTDQDTTNGGSYPQTQTQTNVYYSGNGSLNHTLRYITVPLWYTFNTYVDPGISGNHYKTDRTRTDQTTTHPSSIYKYDSKNSSYNLGISENFDAGQYLDGDWFLAGMGSISWNYSKDFKSESDTRYDDLYLNAGVYTHDVNEYNYDSPNDYRYINIDGMVGPGRGRIYDGVYAFIAISMVEQLKSKGQLKREPTYDEMMKLTEIIYQRSLLHSIDYRYFQIETLDMLMNYLKDIGAIDVSGPQAYSLVQDVWDYYPFGPHEFGWRVRGGIGIDYSRSSSQGHQVNSQYSLETTWNQATPGNVTTNTDTTYYSSYGSYSKDIESHPYVSGLIEYRHPINNNWQFNVDIQGWYYFSETDTSLNVSRTYDYAADSLRYYSESSYSFDRTSHYKVQLSSNIHYYFDERTSFDGYLTLAHEAWDQDYVEYHFDTTMGGGSSMSVDTTTTSPSGIQLSASAYLTYRIAVPTTWDIGFNINRNTITPMSTTVGDRKSTSWDINTGITHYIF